MARDLDAQRNVTMLKLMTVFVSADRLMDWNLESGLAKLKMAEK